MTRFPVWGRRLFALAVPALLLAVLVGCARQDAELAARREAEQAEVAKQEAAKAEAERRAAEEAKRLVKYQEKGTLSDEPPVHFPPSKRWSGTGQGQGMGMGMGQGGLGSGGQPGQPYGMTGAPTRNSLYMQRSEAGKVADGFVPPKPAGPGVIKEKPDAKPQAANEYNEQNAEAYGVYVENEFRSPKVAALSTFSADVNTASYSNVRRFLKEEKLPPAGAVFLAEFVNYFPYSYAQPKGDDPVAFHIEMGPCPWNRKHHLLRIGVQAYQIPADKMPPRNLVFLIDTSGSMHEPNRLPLVKQSLGLLVEKLTDKDRVSIVTYAGEVNVSLIGAKGSEKEKIMRAVNELNARGSTYGEGGIKKAYQLARDTFIDDGVNRVILCTDGDFNVGVTDDTELVKMIEEQRRSKVFLTCLGFGMGNYKDQRLKELANRGNGHHAYIDSIDEAKKVFVEQGGSLVCVAKDVKFQVDFNPAKVTAYRLVGYENRLLKDEDFRNDAKDAGDMGSGHQVTVLYEIVPAGVKIDLPDVEPSKYQKTDGPAAPANVADEWLTVRMRYKHPEAETSKEFSKPLKGDVAKELSDDFRFAAAAASFGMMLRDSKFRGAMTYDGVIEEAQGCLGPDPNGHRKQFLELVKSAKKLNAEKPKPQGNPAEGQGKIDETTLRQLAETWGNKGAEERARIVADILRALPPKFHPMVQNYFDGLDKVHGFKK